VPQILNFEWPLNFSHILFIGCFLERDETRQDSLLIYRKLTLTGAITWPLIVFISE